NIRKSHVLMNPRGSISCDFQSKKKNRETDDCLYQSLNISHKILVTCTLIVRLHKYIICFDLDMYFLIDCNMSITVVAISKHMHLVKFYYFAVTNCKYHHSLKNYIHLKLIAF